MGESFGFGEKIGCGSGENMMLLLLLGTGGGCFESIEIAICEGVDGVVS